MKKFCIILSSFFIITAFSFFYYDVTKFSGEWGYENTRTVFSLSLTQKGAAISGTHCSTLYAGRKIDCAVDVTDIPSIRGTATAADSVNVSFKSTFSGKTGRATIKKIGPNKIQWIIKQEPKGEFHIPMNVVLTKQ